MADAPQGLSLRRQGDRIVFRHPRKTFKKENYVHLDGFYTGERHPAENGVRLTLHERANGGRQIACFALRGSPGYDDVEGMTHGRYRVGGLCGLDLHRLAAAAPTWVSVLSPVHSVERK